MAGANAAITISDPGATNNPQMVPVTLTINPSSTTTKLIGVNTGDTFNAIGGGNYLVMHKFTCEASGSLSQFRIKCNGDCNVKYAIYSDSAGSPDSRLAYQDTGQHCVNGWNALSIGPVSVTSGNVYWLAMICDSIHIYYNNSGGNAKYMSQSYATASWPSSAGTGWTDQACTWAFAGWGTSSP